MRTIKFRAKNKSGCWVYGIPFYSYGTGVWSIACSNGCVPSYNNPVEGETTEYIPIDPNTMCQFTGLRDKNGIEVYDRDLLKSNAECVDDEDCDIYEIFYYESTGACMIENVYPIQSGNVSYAGGWRIDEMFEVCGNTIDNKDIIND